MSAADEISHPVVRRLVAARYQVGMSQRELARRMGTQQSAISEAERGVTSPMLSTLTRWAAVFGLEIAIAPRPLSAQRSAEGAPKEKP